MPSAHIISFPTPHKLCPLRVVKSTTAIGEEALVISSETHSELCFARDDLREMIKLSPDKAAPIANRIYALRETLDDAQVGLTKLLQKMGRT
ncbi:hypothetical protein [Pseudovibrio sp. Tun.PSC04-5.I4]|uniref:hypothetical protein n=1 Tax=Pseudovibrio sp. Tun.PSC04-5.I4 TaxID=1798213 RepID=UPI00088A000C|nr:hypothetical protein [Pseudovibrio sp. Tun.PSC04-5.I4]SDR11112.1 hypothetical protein SAMN04515695_2822 [Pseudovibrio sp. Tun.PSC04-5.I4]SDR34936.1 hypothetical protein SAMN04515695_4796 [Pseudovibrio sp. Tun.PSC04-5.I4]